MPLPLSPSLVLLDTPSSLSHFLSSFTSPFLHLLPFLSPHGGGFLCWLLLGTPTAVYLLDALALRPALRSQPPLRRLFNERLLANPHVLKLVPSPDVRHALQRDLGGYLVNTVTLEYA